MGRLEHANITVPDPEKTAAWMYAVFDWNIRWQGSAGDGGLSIHVGRDDQYIALHRPTVPLREPINDFSLIGGCNHIGIVVDDLDDIISRLARHGYAPRSQADYDPGRRIYFRDENEIEFEIVSYT